MRFEALFLAPLIGVAACSFFAPSDAELMGGSRPGDPPGGGAGAGAGGSASSNGGAGALGSGAPGSATAGDASDPEGGAGSEPSEPGPGGAGGDGPAPTGDGPASTSMQGLVLWLRADVGLVEEGGAVASWEDGSGQANHATQSLAAARPKPFQRDAASLPMLDFDGVDDYLTLPQGFADFSAGLTFFVAVEELSAVLCPSVLQLSSGSEINDLDFGLESIRTEALCGVAGCRTIAPNGSTGGMGRTMHYEVAELWFSGPGGVLSPSVPNVLSVLHRADMSFELRVNAGSLPGTMPLPKVGGRVSNFIGRTLYTGCRPFRGRVGEILLYARALSDAERDRVQAYLVERWQ